MNKKISTKQLTILGLLTALMCVLAPLSISTSIVPISLASFVVYLIAYLVDVKYSVTCDIMYIAIGAIGLPVFSGFQGGLQKLTGPTGGYIIGYIFVSLIVGIAVKLFKGNLVAYIFSLLMGTAVLYAFGTAWFMHVTNLSLGRSLALCVYPFIALDIVKIIVASVIAPSIKKGFHAVGL